MIESPKFTWRGSRTPRVETDEGLTVRGFELDYGRVPLSLGLSSRRDRGDGKLYYNEQIESDLMRILREEIGDKYRDHKLNGSSGSYYTQDSYYLIVQGEVLLQP